MREETPKTIYLQWFGEDGPELCGTPVNGEVSWCEDKVFEHDVKYLRADETDQQVAALEAQLATEKERADSNFASYERVKESLSAKDAELREQWRHKWEVEVDRHGAAVQRAAALEEALNGMLQCMSITADCNLEEAPVNGVRIETAHCDSVRFTESVQRAMKVADSQSSPQTASREPGSLPGDWTCKHCQALNGKQRKLCYACAMDRL